LVVANEDSMSPVSTQQAVAAPPKVSKIGAALEENGLMVVVLGAFAIVLLVSLRRGLAPDGWLALVSGRWIVQHGLPSHDTLTVMAHGRRWTDQQWLGQLVLYGLWRLGGIKLAMLVSALFATSGLVGTALIAKKHGATARSVTWIAILAMVAYFPVAAVMRTQVFAFPLFAATLWLALEDARRPSRRVFLTLPLLALWANLHGSVLLGCGLVASAGLVSMVQRRRPSGRGLALLLAPWLCIFISPYALHLPAYYQKVLLGSDFKHVVTEWAPTTLTAATAPMFLLVLGGLWLLGRNARALPVYDQVVFVAMAVIAFQAIRNLAWIALVALAVLPPLIDRMRSPVEEPKRLNRILALVIIGSALVSLAGVAAKPTNWFTHAFPAGGVQAVAAAARGDGRVFATSPYADWVLWNDPRLSGRVAFDTRFELLSGAQFDALGRIESASGDWRKSLSGYRVFVLGRKNDRTLEVALRRDLRARVVFSSPQVVVLQRRG
jgi:hypothetical protein